MSDPRPSPDWIEVRDAITRVTRELETLPAEQVPLAEAHGRVIAQRVTSPIDQPPWDNSAMDGYATRAADVIGASKQHVRLRVIENVPAGGFPELTLGPGQATRIMTGAPLPTGADTVIRVEHTQHAGLDNVLILNDLDASKNVRFRGEDLRRGDIVLAPGRLLRAAEIGLLATVGAKEVDVTRKPVAAILSTGNELADLDEYEQVAAGRKIANSNSYAIAAGVSATGALPRVLGIARDDADSLREHLDRARGADLLITTAGASVGDHDLVKDVLLELGFQLEFWRVRMRPGSPFSFGWLGLDGTRIPVFGLPGNPVSALVTFELFVRPALRRLLGRTELYSPTLTVRADGHIASKSGLTHFLRARLRRENGEWLAQLTGAQGSGLITSMAHADALLIVPEHRDGLEDGESANAIRLQASDDAQVVIGF